MSSRLARLRPLLIPTLLWLVHAAALQALYATGVTGRLLGAVSPSIALALALLGFYVLRLVVFFVVPGWMLLAMVDVARAFRRGTPRSDGALGGHQERGDQRPRDD